jgi:hypothetical protein
VKDGHLFNVSSICWVPDQRFLSWNY